MRGVVLLGSVLLFLETEGDTLMRAIRFLALEVLLLLLVGGCSGFSLFSRLVSCPSADVGELVTGCTNFFIRDIRAVLAGGVQTSSSPGLFALSLDPVADSSVCLFLARFLLPSVVTNSQVLTAERSES